MTNTTNVVPLDRSRYLTGVHDAKATARRYADFFASNTGMSPITRSNGSRTCRRGEYSRRDDTCGAPTCMSGWLRNKSVTFSFKGTGAQPGYVIEISAPRRASGRRKACAPDYRYDFSAKAA